MAQQSAIHPGTVSPVTRNEFFDYFTAIEARFNARRGSLLLLSTLDWALIETWREAGVPLEAVLRGIDTSFDRYEQRAARAAAARTRLRKVNGLAWCAQAVMEATEQLVEASTGLPANHRPEPADNGFETDRVAAFLERNADAFYAAGQTLSALPSRPVVEVLAQTGTRLRELATAVRGPVPPPLEELDRTLTVLGERLLATLRAEMSEEDLLALGAAADHELGPARARLGALQSRRIREQFIGKRLLETYRLPRLSLFYMSVGE